MRLIAPIARVRIADNEFISGDGYLKFVSVELGEDARSSSCRFEINDPELDFAGKYFEISFKEGGIQVPADLLAAKPKQPPPTVAGTGLINIPGGGGESTFSVDGVGSWLISKTPHIPENQKAEFWAGIQSLSSELGIDPNYLPIIMVTETGVDGFINPAEGHGNDAEGCGGLIQFCTWGGATEVGYPPSVIRGLSAVDQLPLVRKYLSTKQIPSGADLATTYLAILNPASMPIPRGQDLGIKGQQSAHLYDSAGRITKESLESGLLEKAKVHEFNPSGPSLKSAPTPPPIADTTKAQTTPPADGSPPPAKAEPAKPSEESKKGTEIIIELGYEIDRLISFHFIHTGTTANGRSPGSTVFEGQSIRWMMSRRTKNSTYENITLRQLAEIICQGYGLSLEMEGDGPTYQFLDQSGISDYQLLLREAKAIGYRVTDDGAILKISPWRPNFTGFVITPDILDKISFSDRATAEMQKKITPESKTSTTDTTAGEQKTEIDLATGKIKQIKPEDSTGTGTGTMAMTGAATTEVKGMVDQSEAKATSDMMSPVVPGSDDKFSDQLNPVTEQVKPLKPEDPKAATISSFASTSTPFKEEKTGLPTQEIGAIDLADGKAEAIAIKDESRRVKGYESNASFKATPESLTLAPGSIIGIAERCFKSEAAKKAFCREWRVGRVKHTLQPGNFRTDIDFYTPQAAKPPATAPTVAGTGLKNTPDQPSTATPGQFTPNAGGFIWPMKGWYTSPYGPRWGRLHGGIDIAGDEGTPILAVADGKVIFVGQQNPNNVFIGFGKLIDIEHADKNVTRYAHLSEFKVAEGQTVKQGDIIALSGNTGTSTGPHLHFEICIGSAFGEKVDPIPFFPQGNLAVISELVPPGST